MKRLTPLKAIKLYCFECMGGNCRLVQQCASAECSLHPYRDGHNPFHKGIGGKRKDPKTGKFVKTEKLIRDKEMLINGKYRLVRIEDDELPDFSLKASQKRK